MGARIKNTVKGIIETTLDDFTASHGESAHSYFEGARQFYQAVNRLTDLAAPRAVVAAQCLELTLKAFLLQKGMTAEDFKRRGGIGHNLAEAWAACIERGLDLPAELPLWARHLHACHGPPFLFRYARENSGIAMPPLQTLLEGLQSVMDTVARATTSLTADYRRQAQ